MVDWSIVATVGAALAAGVAAVAAIVTAIILVWQTRHTLHVQTLGQFITLWQSPPLFPRMRKAAAQAIIESSASPSTSEAESKASFLRNRPHIDEVLDFFETISLLTKQGVLNFEHAYSTFCWPMSCYWVLAESYIRDTQIAGGEEVWKEYADLMLRFISRAGTKPTHEEAKQFLADEIDRASTE